MAAEFDPSTLTSVTDGKTSPSSSDILSALSDDKDSDDKTDDKSETTLVDDEDEKPKPKAKVKDDEDEDKDEDESEDEDVEDDGLKDDEETDEADEDELELAKIPRRAEIKAKYPTIFKDFPALDHIFHREKAYSEILPTLADARQAKEDQETFSAFKGELLSGELEGVLKSVKATDEKAYDKIVANYFNTLYKVDKDAHLGLTNNILKGALKHIYDQVKDAIKDSEEEQLLFAVRRLNKTLYNTNEPKGPDVKESKTSEEDPEKLKLKTERDAFERTKFQEAVSDVTTRVETKIHDYVEKNIDPKEILPVYVRNKLIEDVMNSLDKNLKSELRYLSVISRLWVKAKSENYSSESRAKIRKTVLDKTNAILPGIMRSKKAEAIKGLGLRRSKSDDVDESSRNDKEEKRESSGKKVTSTRRDSDRLVPREGESNLDFLMRD